MFKIGNSKELPAIPDSLSREGQEFVRLCLQRSPAHRPTAAQLLEHPFVQDAPRVASCDDPLSNSDLLPSTTSGIRSLVSRLFHGLRLMALGLTFLLTEVL